MQHRARNSTFNSSTASENPLPSSSRFTSLAYLQKQHQEKSLFASFSSEKEDFLEIHRA
jgi:hypothetical protein